MRSLADAKSEVIGKNHSLDLATGEASELSYSNSGFPLPRCLPGCLHCGRPAVQSAMSAEGEPFCCAGCEAIYRTIHGLGLEDFYKLRAKEGFGWQDVGPLGQVLEPEWFESPEFAERFVKTDQRTGISSVELHLEGIHCLGCVWLLERLPHVVPGISSSRLDMITGVLQVQFDSRKIGLGVIARTVRGLGYRPAPLEERDSSKDELAHDRELLQQVGIAGFCAANTMLLAVSLFQGFFTGIEPIYATYFRWASLVLAIPAVCYSAQPFYKTAIGGLRAGGLHIDLPVVIAILAAFGVSVFNTVTGREYVYYDSVTALIFLLLVGRLLQFRATRRARAESRIAWNVLPVSVTTLSPEGAVQDVPVRRLARGDRFYLRSGERLPVDGVVVEGSTQLDMSFLTGESQPISVSIGTAVDCGGLNVSDSVVVEVLRPYTETSFGQMVEDLARGVGERPRVLRFTDRVGQVFVRVVILLAILTWVGWGLSGRWAEGAENALTLLIVTCPCALAIATPLTFSLAIARAAKRGMLISGPDTIERLDKTEHLYLDKTGTVTEGIIAVDTTFFAEGLEAERVKPLVRALAGVSADHPAARGVLTWAGRGELENILEPQVRLGKGVSAVDHNGEVLRFGSFDWVTSTDLDPASALLQKALENRENSQVLMSRGPQLLAVWILRDRLRVEAPAVCATLRQLGKQLFLVSGDQSGVVTRVGDRLGIARNNSFGNRSPEQKAEILRADLTIKAMVGDGVNDGLAMREANVAIAIRGGVRVNSAVADVLISDGNLSSIGLLFVGARRTMIYVHRALLCSFGYNVCAAVMAMAGGMNPLIAAFVMPLSSLSALSAALLLNPFRDSALNRQQG